LDVFDTVWTRACGRPEDLFLWLGRKARKQGLVGCSPEIFALARVQSEQAVWRREGGLDSKASLQDFYLEVTRRLHLKEALIPNLIILELTLEKQLQKTVPSARRLIQYCRQHEIPVSFVSDTYLPATFIREVLQEADLSSQETEYLVSSELAASKASGKLFQKMSSDACGGSRILHVGDHPHSDVAMAQRFGLSALWCNDARLNRYEHILAFHSLASSGLSSAFAGASRMARLSTEATNQHEVAIRDVAAGVAAPALVGYLLWILRRAQDRSLERLVFLARDGQVMFQIAKKLIAKFNFSIDVRYLHVSRRSTNLAATFEADEEETGWIFRDVPQLSIAEFLDRFDLELQEVVPLLDMDQSLDAAWESSWIADTFKEKLSGKALRGLVLEKARMRRERVAAYFEQSGLFENIPTGIVDFGGVGSQVRAVHAIIDAAGAPPPTIFLVGLDDPADAGLPAPTEEPRWLRATECYLYDHRRRIGIRRFRGFGTAMQMFCSADHGTVIDYFRSGGSVAPVLQCGKDERIITWGLPTYRSTISSFLAHLVLDEKLVDPFADVRDPSCEVLREFWTNPTRNEALAWGSYPFEGAQASGGETKRLVRQYTLRSILLEIRNGGFPDLGWQHWYEGSLAVSGTIVRTSVRQAEKLYWYFERKGDGLSVTIADIVRRLAGR
jgi:FMN phosphatase YigB (HAD superfamily)